jgi:hypothetical protein
MMVPNILTENSHEEDSIISPGLNTPYAQDKTPMQKIVFKS